ARCRDRDAVVEAGAFADRELRVALADELRVEHPAEEEDAIAEADLPVCDHPHVTAQPNALAAFAIAKHVPRAHAPERARRRVRRLLRRRGKELHRALVEARLFPLRRSQRALPSRVPSTRAGEPPTMLPARTRRVTTAPGRTTTPHSRNVPGSRIARSPISTSSSTT